MIGPCKNSASDGNQNKLSRFTLKVVVGCSSFRQFCVSVHWIMSEFISCSHLNLRNTLEKISLKKHIERTSQRVTQNAAARTLHCPTRAHAIGLARPLIPARDPSPSHSLVQLLGRSLDRPRSLIRSLARPTARSIARSIARSLKLFPDACAIACLFDRSIIRSLACSSHDSVARAVARWLDL